MSTSNISSSSMVRGAGLALVAAAAVWASAPSAAIAAPREATQMSPASSATRAAIEAGAASKKHHHARRSNARDAFGSMSGGAVGPAAPSSGGYGYGVGDNSRNQTW